jgi:aldehyde:ferredoxin oxidoreductase
MVHGWMGKMLVIDLSTGDVATRDTLPYLENYLGGRALAARIAWEEIPAGIDAYDPQNCIIITTGPLTGTLSPTSGRTVMSSLSPRVYPRVWYTHSTLGGWFGAELKYAGYDALVIRGKSEKPVYLLINDDDVKLRDGSELWGEGSRKTQLKLKAQHGQGTQIMAIGQAGENLVRFATVQHAEENAAAHSGFGAVWGSKKLKAVVVKGSKGVSVADPPSLMNEVFGFGTYRVTPNQGTLWNVGPDIPKPICSQSCTNNCFVTGYGQMEDGRRVPNVCVGISWVGGEEMTLTEYDGGCIKVPKSKNFKIPEEVKLHELCNDLGLDLWFRLVMVPWFLRCEELGIHEIRGYPIDISNRDWFETFMIQMAKREGLGDLFAEDLIRVVDMLEKEIPAELIELGRRLEFGYGLPAHREGRIWDHTPLPFWVISLMMYISETRDPTIGSHNCSMLLGDFMVEKREEAIKKFRVMSKKIYGYEDALDPTFENKAPVAIWTQNNHMLIDSLPLCDFAFPQVMRSIKDIDEWLQMEDISGDIDIDRRLFAAVTGIDMTRDQFNQIAERAFNLERALMARSGRGRWLEETLAPQYELPCKSDGTSINKEGFLCLMDEYYLARGWDLKMGWPTEETLRALDLEEIIPEMNNLRASTVD